MFRDGRNMKITKRFIALIIAIVAIIVVLAIVVSSYNGMVGSEQKVDSQWAQVQVQFERKVALIPQLVSTVSAYAEFEKSTLTNITKLRGQWLNASSTDDKVQISNALNAQLYKVTVTYENYPDLKTIYAVSSLMDELAGTENRIAVEKMRYNDNVRDYNSMIKSFPGVMFAGMWGFHEKPYYYSTPGSPTGFPSPGVLNA